MTTAQRPQRPDRFDGLGAPAIDAAAQALRALQRGDAAAALAALERVGADSHTQPELMRLRGLAHLQSGDPTSALNCLRLAATTWSEDALIACQLGVALACCGEASAAEQAFVRATQLDPTLVEAWYNLGHACDARDDAVAAAAAFGQVLQLEPAHLDARVMLAETRKVAGRLDEAERELREALRRDPACVSAWVGLSNLKTFRPTGDDLDRLLALHQGGRVAAARRVDFMFALATFLEAAGRYREAFALFVEANRGKRATLGWNAPAVSGLVDAIIARFARAAEVPVGEVRGSEAIFLVGMPRSGSTLAEQILCSHPQVQGGGERDDIVQVLQQESQRRGVPFPTWADAATASDWARLGEDYLQRCRAWRDARPRFTDKTLTNWQTLGAIRRMLPGAHVIHCRRDALETLWSCYKHNFGAAQFFSCDFDELVAFWHDCERAMRQWKRDWPAWIHDFTHEALLADAPGQIRALLAACGLDFDPACLQFHATAREVRTSSASQVRQPLRRDLAVAARYGDLLAPLRQRMERIVKLQAAE